MATSRGGKEKSQHTVRAEEEAKFRLIADSS